jgi:UDP-N-acetylglucosamine diphosphorylase/glucosamine-1-phosphate N-acetyltransferase
VWDFIRYLPEQLADDIKRAVIAPPPLGLRERVKQWTPPSHATVLGDHAVVVHGEDSAAPHSPAAVVEPHVVFDATAGPIYVAAGAHIRAFTRLVGPCYVATGATILGGDVSACSIGPVSKVRGEISTSIVLGYSNKGHDGFVGHSYLGRWVNLGAGTITSNLKNTYGSVALWTPAGVRETGLQYLGTLFGDHAKTGIGTPLTTGCVMGAGANVFGAVMPPKTVPPFAWGNSAPYDVHDLGKFVETAERMMKRRDVAMSDRMREHWQAVHAGRWSA